MTPPNTTTCSRDGCTGRRRKDPATGKLRPACTGICHLTSIELQQLQAMITEVGPGPATGAAWAALVELSDQLTRYYALKTTVYRLLKNQRKDHAQT